MNEQQARQDERRKVLNELIELVHEEIRTAYSKTHPSVALNNLLNHLQSMLPKEETTAIKNAIKEMEMINRIDEIKSDEVKQPIQDDEIKEGEMVFTHYLNNTVGWIEAKLNPKDFDKVDDFYSPWHDIKLFCATNKHGYKTIFKGHRKPTKRPSLVEAERKVTEYLHSLNVSSNHPLRESLIEYTEKLILKNKE